MGTECTIRVPDEVPGMPLRTAIELYRICQEAVHNAARHGRATRVEIFLEERNEVWRLEIRDNGSGLPPPDRRRDGLGLRLMAHRAESVGGTIAFVPGERGGLIVRCAVPVPRSESVAHAR
jgi:signal transduction histidine kinase